MKITVRYFAALRDQRGASHEILVDPQPTPAALYAELQGQHRFSLTPAQVRFAVNGQYVEPTHNLKDGDEVVFIPPVAGG